MPGPRQPRAPAGASAQLGVSTRARADPKRRVGNGNALAAGVDLSRVGVMSDHELDWIRRLAYATSLEAEQQKARQQEEERRRALCEAKTSHWDDTIEARQDRFVKSQQEIKDAAEARRKALDVLYAEQDEAEHQTAISRVELYQLKEDARVRNAHNAAHLHETLKVREEQVAFKKAAEDALRVDAVAELREMQAKDWEDKVERARSRLVARERNMEEKNENLEIILHQLDERRRMRADEKADRLRVDAEAAEERLEREEEDADRRQRELENGLHNLANSRKAVTKAQRLEKRIQEEAVDAVEREREEAKLDSMKQQVRDKQRRKQEAFEERKKGGFEAYLAETAQGSPAYRTQDLFEAKGTSLLEQMHNQDVARKQVMREAEAAAFREMAEAEASGAEVRRHRAATTAAGFINMAEEQAYLEEMRTYPAKVKAEEDAEAAARRDAAKRVEVIQKLQAEEKRENARREVERRREEYRLQQEQEAEEAARFQGYIDTLIPEDMSLELQAKARQLH